MRSRDLPVSYMKSREGFLVLEYAKVKVKDSSLEVDTQDGRRVQLPVSTIGTVFIGPGCSVTTDAVGLLAEMGTGIVWCRGDGIRMLGSAIPVARTGRPAMAQAYKWANPIEHLIVVHHMYDMRFGDGFSQGNADLKSLRGREGVRVKASYAALAKEHGVRWNKRTSRIDHADSDRVNRALNTAHHYMDGVAHSIIVGMGLVPQLGFIHTDSATAFVLDVSDLYKVSIADPVAFRVAGDRDIGDEFLETTVRDELRVTLGAKQVHSNMVKDLRNLIGSPEEGFTSPTTYWNP